MSDLTGIFIAQSPKQLLLTIAMSAMVRRSFRTCSKTTPRFEHLYGTCNNAEKSNITIGTHVLISRVINLLYAILILLPEEFPFFSD